MIVSEFNWLKSLIARDDGVTAIEYGLIAALSIVGTALNTTFTTISGALQNANAS